MRSTLSRWQRQDWLLGPLVCLAVSGLFAVGYVLAQGGFGAGDLTAVLVWTVPLALLLGLLARLSRPLWARFHPLLAWLLAAFLGLGAGLIWTLGAAMLIGPWFGAFSVPVLFCWAGGGLSGLVAGSALHVPHGRRHLGALLLPIALFLAAGYPPVTAALTKSEQTQLVFLHHDPGPGQLSVEDPHDRLTPADLDLLRASGLTGQVRVRGTYAFGRGRVNRALLVMSRQVAGQLDLPQPYRSTVLYIQEEVDFRLHPPDAQTQPYPIRLSVASHDQKQTHVDLWRPDGSRVGTTGFTWSR